MSENKLHEPLTDAAISALETRITNTLLKISARFTALENHIKGVESRVNALQGSK
jgi:hypothetical protein